MQDLQEAKEKNNAICKKKMMCELLVIEVGFGLMVRVQLLCLFDPNTIVDDLRENDKSGPGPDEPEKYNCDCLKIFVGFRLYKKL